MASRNTLDENDQTDEDFFDKLVDDDFGSRSHPEAGEIARELCHLSLVDVDAGKDDLGDNGFTSDVVPASLSVHSIDSEAVDETLQSGGGLMDSSLEKINRSNVKEVQWSSFYADSQELDFEMDNVASCLTEVPDANTGMNSCCSEEQQHDHQQKDSHNPVISQSQGSNGKGVGWSSFHSDNQQLDNAYGSFTNSVEDSSKFSFTENSVGSGTSHMKHDSSERQQHQQDSTQSYSLTTEQSTKVNDPQHWEKLYPGWKYDTYTGQWYQVEGYTADNGCDLPTTDSLEGFGGIDSKQKCEDSGDGFLSNHTSKLSHFPQASVSVVREVADDPSNHVSLETNSYPPNMIFDPQYPGWYYDTNTQQWHSLGSYTQPVQGTSEELMSQGLSTSHGYGSKENSFASNETGQFGHISSQKNYSSYHDSENNNSKIQGSAETATKWDGSLTNYAQLKMWQPEAVNNSSGEFTVNSHVDNFYGENVEVGHSISYQDHQMISKAFEPVTNPGYSSNNSMRRLQTSIPAECASSLNQPKADQNLQSQLFHSYYDNQNIGNFSPDPYQASSFYSQSTYASVEGRSSAGRPPHPLVTFGFGGRLIIAKEPTTSGSNLDRGSQDTGGVVLSIFSLTEILMDKSDLNITKGGFDYINTLCEQAFPGPLIGGNAATKDVHKWIEEKVIHCESAMGSTSKGESLKLLVALLKIACQNYGMIRSQFGSDPSLEEGAESAITKLFLSASKNSAGPREYSHISGCLQSLPSEAQIRETSVEVQNLLVSGQRKEAIDCAQQGQLWGPALVLAAQLGEKFYVDTVKKMAYQFACGSPLRTLCLLIAGQPAEVFAADGSSNRSQTDAFDVSRCTPKVQSNSMLDEWIENLAIITANRTKNDELVMMYLGDCLWKERGEVTAAHICYLVAEANFELYSDSARLCLIGADHWKNPRTYATPEAIQRTELYEYSKVLGNSQFILLPFQPYKLIYAYMLTEVGKVSDALRYCQASLKALKNSNRTPEVETWRSLLSSLEERLRMHQQGGYSTNLDPTKLVGKLFTSIDRSIHRMIGAPAAPPSPAPQVSESKNIGKESYSVSSKVVNGQYTTGKGSLVPSASVEAISEWSVDGNRKIIMHNRSVSEPTFGGNPQQVAVMDEVSPDSENKGSGSRLGRFFQKTMGWVSRSRPDRQAKLGERNTFYYDEKLKRWAEEGTEPQTEEPTLGPPPTMTLFQNGLPNSNISSSFNSPSPVPNGHAEVKPPTPSPSEYTLGFPPMPPTTNQFSARGRVGVRSRYVDTFNKGGGSSTNTFQSPMAATIKPPSGAKFFVPATLVTSEEKVRTREESGYQVTTDGEQSTPPLKAALSSSSPSSLSPTIRRFPSMNSSSPGSKGNTPVSQAGISTIASRTRAASWSGSYSDMLNANISETNTIGDKGGVQPFLIPNKLSGLPYSGSSPQLVNGTTNDLHDL